MILLLAGTGEARALAGLLGRAGVPTVASLAGATRAPIPLGVPTRVGGFGATAGLARFLADARAAAVIDATHPFAARMGRAAAEATAALGLPLLRVERPDWEAGPGDRWLHAEDAAGACALVPRGAAVLLATGGRSLAAWGGLQAARVVVRALDPPADAPPGAELILARPPHDEASERALLARLGVTHLIARNAGGAGRAKLDAARALGVEVILLRRPPRPAGVASVATAEDALAWALARTGRTGQERA